jgi:hypothetical protein
LGLNILLNYIFHPQKRDEKNPKIKRFKLFPREQPCLQRSKAEVASRSNHVLRGIFIYLFSKT